MAGPAYRIVYAPIAEAQIEAALLWWERNRRQSPALLAREIEAALDQLEVVPQAGRRVLLRGHPDARRLLLPRTRYHVYYVIADAERDVRVVYFRHGRRRPLQTSTTR